MKGLGSFSTHVLKKNNPNMNFQRTHLRAVLDRALELDGFGEGEDPFKANLLWFCSIRGETEV